MVLDSFFGALGFVLKATLDHNSSLALVLLETTRTVKLTCGTAACAETAETTPGSVQVRSNTVKHAVGIWRAAALRAKCHTNNLRTKEDLQRCELPTRASVRAQRGVCVCACVRVCVQTEPPSSRTL